MKNRKAIMKKQSYCINNHGLSIVLTSLLALTGALHPAAAQTPAVGFTPNAYGVTDNAADANGPGGAASYSLGFEFTANTPEFATALGYFNDPSFDPTAPFNTVSLSPEASGSYMYASAHQVGLYQVVPGTALTPETGLLLAQASVTNSSMADGDFLYAPLAAAVPLLPGVSYVLAGVTGGTDPYLFNIEDDTQTLGGIGLTTSGITYTEDRYADSSALVFPGSTDTGSEPGFFGPNLLTSMNAPVPEASTTVSLGLLLALGLAGLGLSAHRRSHSL